MKNPVMRLSMTQARYALGASLVTLVVALPTTAVGQSCFPSPQACNTPGVVRTWGSNVFGQLGNGTDTDSHEPVEVSGLTNVVQVSGGVWFSVALKADGTVWAWGSNQVGELGIGTGPNSHVPVQVPGLAGVVKISSGHSFTLALKSDGTVWVWGQNNFSLGDGTTATQRHTPVQVIGLSGIVDIAAGSTHGLATNGFKIWAWGSNLAGELGNGTKNITLNSTPVQVVLPSPIPGAVNVTGLAAGFLYSLAQFGDGKVMAWGTNISGAFANGTNTDSTLPVVVIASGVFWSHASRAWGNSSNHSLFVVDDVLSAAGANVQGQLGNGTTTASNTRIQVPGLGKLQTFVFQPQAVAAADYSLAAVIDGSAWAWGLNDKGQLGNGTTLNSTVPVQVSGLESVVSVGAGLEHSLAIVAPIVTIENRQLDFGSVGTGTTSAAQVATIRNHGPGPLTITSISLACTPDPEFLLTAPAVPLTLASGESTSLSVKFAPVSTGPQPACVAVIDNGFFTNPSIPQNGGSRGLQFIELDGSGDPFADIELRASTVPAAAIPGDTIAYVMTVTNNGRAVANTATVAGSLPSDLTFVSCAAGGNGVCSVAGNDWSVAFSPLQPGDSAEVVIQAQINLNLADGKVLSHTATAVVVTGGSCLPMCDGILTNNTVTWTTTIRNRADLFVTQRVAKDKNRQLIYTIQVNNVGPYEARQLVLHDPLPAATRFVSSVAGAWSCTVPPAGAVGTVSCTLGTLAAGETKSITLVVKTVAAGSVDVVNTATVSALTFDPNTANNSATLVTRVPGK